MAIKKGEKIMDKEKPIAEEEQAVEKKEAANVHQVIPAGEKGWAVKRMNSTKVIKYFPTKKEALEYVTQVCEKPEHQAGRAEEERGVPEAFQCPARPEED